MFERMICPEPPTIQLPKPRAEPSPDPRTAASSANAVVTRTSTAKFTEEAAVPTELQSSAWESERSGGRQLRASHLKQKIGNDSVSDRPWRETVFVLPPWQHNQTLAEIPCCHCDKHRPRALRQMRLGRLATDEPTTHTHAGNEPSHQGPKGHIVGCRVANSGMKLCETCTHRDNVSEA